MRDLDDVVAAGLEERERRIGAAPDGVLDRVARRVRRNRARRHALQGVAAVAVVAAVGGAGWWGVGQRHAPVPALTPPVVTSAAPTPTTTLTSTPTPTPTLASTPAVTPSAAALATDVLPARYGLPTLHALPDDVWNRTGSGWALAVYRPLRNCIGRDCEAKQHLPNTLVLASPDGTLYQVRDLADPTAELVSWHVGSTSVRLSDGRTMDLVTEAITGEHNGWLEDPYWYLGETPDGRSLRWSVEGLAVGDPPINVGHGVSGGLVSPDGRRVAFEPPTGHPLSSATVWDGYTASFGLYDTMAGTTTSVPYGVAGDLCEVLGWTTSSSVLTLCVTEDFVTQAVAENDLPWDEGIRANAAARQALAKPAYYTVDVTGSTPTALAESLDLTRQPIAIGGRGTVSPSDGVVVYVGENNWGGHADCLDGGLYRWQDGKSTTLVTTGYSRMSYTPRVAGGLVWFSAGGLCAGDRVPSIVSVVGPGGSPRVVFPGPGDAVVFTDENGSPPADGEFWSRGITSWAAAQ